MAGSEAIEYWQQLRQLVNETEHYPLLLGSQDEIENHLESIELYNQCSPDNQLPHIAEIIKRGNDLNANKWLNKAAQERREEWEDFWEDVDPPIVAEVEEWNDAISIADERYTITYDILTRQPYPNVVVAMIPTVLSWQVPAFLKFGNWNDCPAPEIHVCLMKYWHQKYGAEVVGISHDVVEMCVNNPPQNREDAFVLAQEQYIYCYDIVDQGVQTLSNLAATLLQRKVWYFWWD